MLLLASASPARRRLLEQAGVEVSDRLVEVLAELDDQGESSLIVAVGGRVLGVIGVRDTVRESARDVLNQLRDAGVASFAVLTGDREAAARQIERGLIGVDTVEAGLLPADKADWVENATAQGRRVAMVGDGVNDAPALATATVGIALGGVGSDIAAEAGDLILMGDPLRPLPGLLRLSRRLVQTIRQSIYLFAFGMNGCGMVLGATGILSPGAAAVFHEVASLAVMLNALRLLWFERWEQTRLGSVSRSLGAAAEWGFELLSPSRLVFRFLEHSGVIVRLGAAVLALAWFLSGLVLIQEGQQAVVTRFGRFETVLESGLHWRWPAPFERLWIERVDEVRTVQIGFRATGASGAPVLGGEADEAPEQSETFGFGPIEWTSDHAGQEFEAVTAESVTLTGDEVPVELTAEVAYQISDLREFIFSSSDPTAVLQAIAESSIREVVARVSLDAVMTKARGDVERRVKTDVKATLERYGLGIQVTGISLLDVHPPRQVVASYRQVADAIELHEQLVNEAEAYYARTVLSAAGERAIRRLSDSVSDSPRTRESTTGSVTGWSLTDDLWTQVTRESGQQPMELSGEAAARLHRAHEERTRRVTGAEGSVARFNGLVDQHSRHPSLTGTSLYLQTVSDVLAGRKLTIVDPGVTGKQHMLLLDPDDFATPTFLQPMMAPDEEAPREEAGAAVPAE